MNRKIKRTLIGLFNSHGKSYQELNLDRLQHWIQTGRIDASQPITMKHLLDSRCIHKIEDGVKLLSVVSDEKKMRKRSTYRDYFVHRVLKHSLHLLLLKFLEHHKRRLKQLKMLAERSSHVITTNLV